MVVDVPPSFAADALRDLRVSGDPSLTAAVAAVDAGDPGAMLAFGWMREHHGDAAGAEQLCAAQAQGDPKGAQAWFARAVDAGQVRALASSWLNLTRDAPGAQQLAQYGLEADGSPARPWRFRQTDT